MATRTPSLTDPDRSTPISPAINSADNNVRRLRERLDLTQEELAERVGVDARYIRRLESVGGLDIRVSTLARLSEALECSMGALLRPACPEKKSPGRPRR